VSAACILLLSHGPMPVWAQTTVALPPPPRPGTVTTWTLLADALGGGQANWRSVAIMHLAMHDALNAAEPRFERFAPPGATEPPVDGASPRVAMAAAAFQVLLARHPDQAARIEPRFRAALAEAAAPPKAAEAGIRLGAAIGLAMVERVTAGLAQVELFPASDEPGSWRPTPPFFLRSAVADDPPLLAARSGEPAAPPPPQIGSQRYIEDLAEVRRLGAEGSVERTALQTEAAEFWDRQTSQCGFVHLAVRLLEQQPQAEDPWAVARSMAQLSAALADAYVIAWSEKRRFRFWRPVTAIREGLGGAADPTWEPLRPTPPHPDYPSGHSTDCAAAAGVLQRLLAGPAKDAVTYVAVDARPPSARRFPDLAALVRECSLSRIWAGAHFRAAAEEGVRLGEAIARRASEAFPPLRAPP
jgi:hypothetical protein